MSLIARLLIRLLEAFNSFIMALWLLLFVDYNSDKDFDLPVEEINFEDRKIICRIKDRRYCYHCIILDAVCHKYYEKGGSRIIKLGGSY